MVVINPNRKPARRWIVRGVTGVIAIYALIILALMWWWSYEPAQFDVI